MNKYQLINDLYFTNDGDLRLDTSRNDLQDTKNFQYQGFIQKVLNRIMCSKGDWVYRPDIGANVTEFVGLPNTAETASQIKTRLFTELTKSSLVKSEDLDIVIFPTSKESIAILVRILPPNSQNQIILNFAYDLRNNKLVPRNI